MADKNSKAESKRLPKGQRTHIRRLKQSARKESGMNNPYLRAVQPVRVREKQENPKEVN